MARSTVSTAPVPLLINRDFALLWSGQAISILGDLIFTTTITIWVGIYLAHGQPWAALAVSGILVAAGVPPLLLAPMAGVLADRWDSRRLMVTMDALRALAVLGLLILPFVGSHAWSPLEQWIAVCGVVLLVSCGEQFFRPAMTGLISDLVPEPLQPRAIGLEPGIAEPGRHCRSGTGIGGAFCRGTSVGPRLRCALLRYILLERAGDTGLTRRATCRGDVREQPW